MSAAYDRKIRLHRLGTGLYENCNKPGDHLQIYSEITCIAACAVRTSAPSRPAGVRLSISWDNVHKCTEVWTLCPYCVHV